MKVSVNNIGSQSHFLPLYQKKYVNLGHYEWHQNGRPGCKAWGGDYGRLTFCAGVALQLIEDGTIEEMFLHESVHANHELHLYQMEEWKCARDSDKHYISKYAKDDPLRCKLVLSI